VGEHHRWTSFSSSDPKSGSVGVAKMQKKNIGRVMQDVRRFITIYDGDLCIGQLLYTY
jgi:hypothetical protein